MSSKPCTKCGVDKPFSDFYVRKASKDGLMPVCKACDSTRGHKRNLKHRYNLTPQSFISLVEVHDFKCAICEDQLDLENKQFAVDHNHNTGEVRGMLCQACNKGIGLLKDNPSVLKRAATYLENRGHYG